jgi:hypothetical protein
MHPIVARQQLSPNVTRFVVEAQRIAQIRQPGQFVIVHADQGSERIPLTIADADPAAGTITLIIQAVGKSTEDLVALGVVDAPPSCSRRATRYASAAVSARRSCCPSRRACTSVACRLPASSAVARASG